MNDWERDPDLVHQVFFRWQGNADSPQGPRTGIAPVAYSCDEARAWQLYHDMAPLLRVEGGPDRPSLVRVTTPTGDVVLVHRRAAKEPGGRPTTNCHALVGGAEQLGVFQSIGLVAWKWPPTPEIPYAQGGGPRIAPVRLKDLQMSLRTTSDMVKQRAREPGLAPQLSAITAAVLRAPGHRLSVRSAQLTNRRNRNLAAPLLWGLHEILGERFASGFNFATFDTTDAHRLGIVFVPEWWASAAADPLLSRISLDDLPQPDSVPPGDEAERIARELVGRFAASSEREWAEANPLRQEPWNPSAPVPQQLAALADLLELRQRGGNQLRPPPTEPTVHETRPDNEPPDRTPFESPVVPLTGAGYGHETPAEAERVPEAEAEADVDIRPSDTAPIAPSGPLPVDAPAPAPLREDSFDMPDPFSLWAYLCERRRQHRAARRNPGGQASIECREALRALSPKATRESARRLALLRTLRGLPDTHLLEMLRQEEPNQAARNVLLQALADRSRHRTPRAARHLCGTLLNERLLLYPARGGSSPFGDDRTERYTDRSAVETAAWLFAWGVRPYVRNPGQRSGLTDLLKTVGETPDDTDRQLLLRISVAPYDDIPADFPPEIWKQLMAILLPEAHSMAALSKARNHRARQHRRRLSRSGPSALPHQDLTDSGVRPRSSVESRIFAALAVLLGLLLVLVFFALS